MTERTVEDFAKAMANDGQPFEPPQTGNELIALCAAQTLMGINGLLSILGIPGGSDAVEALLLQSIEIARKGSN